MIRRALLTVVVSAVAVAACGSGSDDVAVPRVVVPNEVLADLVERVACVDPVEVTVATDAIDDETDPPVLIVSLEEPTADDSSNGESDGPLTVSVPALATTIDRPGPDDPWVWLDPIRFAEVANGVGAALTLTDAAEPDLVDRCLARIEAEMTDLDTELFELTQTLPDETRSIDVSAPGTVYFVTRYEFGIDESDLSVRAGRLISTDELGGATSYDDMMRANVSEVVELLGSR